MLVSGEKNQVVSGPQTVAVPILRDMENPLGADNQYKGVYTAALVYKISRSEHFPAGFKDKRRMVGADKVPHRSLLNKHLESHFILPHKF
jgi:hypothetical protein